MKVNRQTSYFLIKKTLQCLHYHSLCIYLSLVFVSHFMYLSLTHSMYLSLRKEREKEWGQNRVLPIIESRTTIVLTNERMGTKQSPSYNRI
jgi:hypothetical protein